MRGGRVPVVNRCLWTRGNIRPHRGGANRSVNRIRFEFGGTANRLRKSVLVAALKLYATANTVIHCCPDSVSWWLHSKLLDHGSSVLLHRIDCDCVVSMVSYICMLFPATCMCAFMCCSLKPKLVHSLFDASRKNVSHDQSFHMTLKRVITLCCHHTANAISVKEQSLGQCPSCLNLLPTGHPIPGDTFPEWLYHIWIKNSTVL